MAAAAVTAGILGGASPQTPSSYSSVNHDRPSHLIPSIRIISPSSSLICGRRLNSCHRKSGSGDRNAIAPVTVSPKAVSDSWSSQTCLDPDASTGTGVGNMLRRRMGTGVGAY
ncbi:unnamed protein product [Victoria cruziana]